MIVRMVDNTGWAFSRLTGLRTMLGLLVVVQCLTFGGCGALAAEDTVPGEISPDMLESPDRPEVEEGAPVFTQEPDPNYYIVKNKPVTITCKAAPAAQIQFRCAGRWMEPEQQITSHKVDPYTSVEFLQSSIDVTKEEVEEYFGHEGYWCECHAYYGAQGSALKSSKSSKGIIQTAYLKKRFEREPISTAVALETSAQLQCLPPGGIPFPEVFWLKDGAEINVDKEMNYIISSEGNLIISQARMEDQGNYTCGAQNVASRRLSESATLIVYVNGMWSSWGQWTECTTKCGKGFQQRQRACNNPAPVNGGSDCHGEDNQRVQCTSVCPPGMEPVNSPGSEVDGYWSTWSSWSTCAVDCKQHRRRMCDNPPPQNGGAQCAGSDLDFMNCTSGLCNDPSAFGFADDGYYGKAGVGPMDKENVAMYVGLIVAIAVFIIVIIIIIILLRRKSQNNGADDKKLNKGVTDHLMISAQPDLTQTVVTIQNHNALDTPNNNHLQGTMEKPSPYADNALNAQKQMLIDMPRTPVKGEGSGTLQSKGDLTDESRPNSIYAECGANNRHSVLSCQVPSNIDADSIVWANVTSQGGRICLANSGISVTIPEGAVKKGSTEEMFIAVSRDDKDRPRLEASQTLLGPVIVIGPPTLSLKKPVVLSFQHCASIKHGQWALSVYGSDSGYDESTQWTRLVTLGQETINTPIYTQVDLSQCHVMTEHFLRYVMVGEPNMAGKAVKILRLAAFAPAVPSGIDYNVRVYFVEDTQDAMEGVMQVERKLGGRLLEKPKQILFQYGGGNLCMTMEDLGPGWKSKLGAKYQEIPFRHIWSGTQFGLHCSFALEHVPHTGATDPHLYCAVHVFQKDLLDNSQALEISCNLTEQKLAGSPAHLKPSAPLPPPRSATVSAAGRTVMLESPTHVFRLPHHIKCKLCQILDPPNARGNDWRMLAQRLSVDRYINYFATKRSPTEHILDLWEARHRDKSAVTELMNSLRVMGRMDATAVLEKECGAWL